MFGNLYNAAQNYLGQAGKAIASVVAPKPAIAATPVKLPTAQAYANHNALPTPVAPKPVQLPTAQAYANHNALPTPQPTPQTQPQAQSYQAPVYQAAQTYQQPAQTYAPADYSKVAGAESALSNYLGGRDSEAHLKQLYSDLGINSLQDVVKNNASSLLSQQNNIETLPKEDIARRGDTGMLSAAQRARITASEQAPLIANANKTQQAQSVAQGNLSNLLGIAGNYQNAYENDTQAGAGGYTTAINDARSAYDAASRQTQAAQQPNAAAVGQQNQAKMESLAQGVQQEVRQGATLQQMMGKYIALGLDPNLILQLYNSNSTKYGPATYNQYAKGDQSGKPSTNLTKLYGIAAANYQ